MFRKFIFTSAAILAVLGFSACKTAAPEQTPPASVITPAEVSPDQLKKIADVYLKDILTGLETNDYKLFVKDFAREYKDTMNPEKFAPLAAGFQAKNGKLQNLKYLDCLDQGIFKSVVWKAKFTRPKAQEEALRRDGKDPAKIPVPELLVRLLLGNVNGEWKAFAIFFN